MSLYGAYMLYVIALPKHIYMVSFAFVITR